MNFFKCLFGKTQEQPKTTETTPVSSLKEHEQKLIEAVINELKTNPENFSARWFDGKTLDSSVRHRNGKILISTQNFEILHPMRIDMTKKQKDTIKELVMPIVEKDSQYVIQNLFSTHD
jgi:hypothetical protein